MDTRRMPWDVAKNRLFSGIIKKVMYWDGENNVYFVKDGSVRKTYVRDPKFCSKEHPNTCEKFRSVS